MGSVLITRWWINFPIYQKLISSGAAGLFENYLLLLKKGTLICRIVKDGSETVGRDGSLDPRCRMLSEAVEIAGTATLTEKSMKRCTLPEAVEMANNAPFEEKSMNRCKLPEAVEMA
eukprot:CAMPEP_0185764138 /NCGR_PEP_ID=MMETSP1174-20130828/23057_1 /TAXON_ID=35687 /ORGANISM="Dictyocha speculum, Strain CCMP1381" /LENGTH=116 /DNA_ID=CAMNT_0028446535 /DNA_START=194 /DNA_END=541 /DNA_ORIENTATION=-